MIRYLQQLLCFSSHPKRSKDTKTPLEGTSENANLIRSIQKKALRARLPNIRTSEHAVVTVVSPLVAPSIGTNNICTATYHRNAETTVSFSSANIDSSPSYQKVNIGSSATPFDNDGTPYVPILQADGTLRPPQISYSGYGSYGGRFIPESIVGFLHDLTSFFEVTVSDPSFWAEYATFQRPQPTPLQMASKLTTLVGGATIWLKREDQNEYGSHKTRNIIGQLLLARRMGRIEIVTDCASAKHGNFTAVMCARLGLRCVVIMGADDAQAQEEDVLEMKMLGAKILTARTPSGMSSLRAAITEALRYLVCNFETTYYLMGGPVGPHPLPTLTRTFQALLGEEVAVQLQGLTGCQPDAVVTAVGSGSGAVGLFRPFLQSPAIRLVGVEAAQAATLTEGELGVLQGARTLMLQNDDGQLLDSHSISPDMNISTVGPEVAHWNSIGRIEISTASDADALDGFKTLQHHEGFLAGLDSSHAVNKAVSMAKELGPGKNLVLLVTGCDGIGMHGLLDV
ncbi:Tryptophan synthase beta chain [Penicillium maclennaniae]|uniref:Tryptophan synthase beta chain n=1 Tax=Penicillium maclennaniae TaxID=1343394 RepID=UPI002541ED01|nr:Tryptophan synthase beta chain [Penicillium maclennaniae]KAJ5662568.1 Tryptophan synthase beta chain [Penicillium maclennaniae]